MKARVNAVQVDHTEGHIWMSVYGPILEDGKCVEFYPAFCPEQDLPGLTPLALASLALGHKVEIDVAKCGESSYAILALRLSEKTRAARVLRIAAEMLPNVGRLNWSGVINAAAWVASADLADLVRSFVYQHLEATGRKKGCWGVTWNAYSGHTNIESVDNDALLKEQIEAFLCVADKLDRENDDED